MLASSCATVRGLMPTTRSAGYRRYPGDAPERRGTHLSAEVSAALTV